MTHHQTAPALSPLLIPDTPPHAGRVKGTRQKYSPEVRAEALRLLKLGTSPTEVARRLGIVSQTVFSWVSASREAAREAAEVPSGIRADLLALRVSLQGRLATLDRERAALTKTLAGVREALDL